MFEKRDFVLTIRVARFGSSFVFDVSSDPPANLGSVFSTDRVAECFSRATSAMPEGLVPGTYTFTAEESGILRCRFPDSGKACVTNSLTAALRRDVLKFHSLLLSCGSTLPDSEQIERIAEAVFMYVVQNADMDAQRRRCEVVIPAIGDVEIRPYGIEARSTGELDGGMFVGHVVVVSDGRDIFVGLGNDPSNPFFDYANSEIIKRVKETLVANAGRFATRMLAQELADRRQDRRVQQAVMSAFGFDRNAVREEVRRLESCERAVSEPVVSEPRTSSPTPAGEVTGRLRCAADRWGEISPGDQPRGCRFSDSRSGELGRAMEAELEKYVARKPDDGSIK
jgi:hypothetical protein